MCYQLFVFFYCFLHSLVSILYIHFFLLRYGFRINFPCRIVKIVKKLSEPNSFQNSWRSSFLISTLGTNSLPTLQMPCMYLVLKFQRNKENELKLNSSQCATYTIRRTTYALRILRETCCESIRRRGTLARLRRNSIISIIKYHSRAGKKRQNWFPLSVSRVYL